MTGDLEREKFDEMAVRIRQAGPMPEPAEDDAPRDDADVIKASRIGFDFVAAVVGCAVIGWFADREFGTAPWGLLAMLLVGFIGGAANVWRALSGRDQAVGLRKTKSKE